MLVKRSVRLLALPFPLAEPCGRTSLSCQAERNQNKNCSSVGAVGGLAPVIGWSGRSTKLMHIMVAARLGFLMFAPAPHKRGKPAGCYSASNRHPAGERSTLLVKRPAIRPDRRRKREGVGGRLCMRLCRRTSSALKSSLAANAADATLPRKRFGWSSRLTCPRRRCPPVM